MNPLRSVLVFAFVLFGATAVAQVTGEARMPRHPRLLLKRGGEKQLLRDVRRDSTWSDIHRGLLGVADDYVKNRTEPVSYVVTGRRLLGVSREALRRVAFLGYAFRTTKDKAYALRARRELAAIAAFPDWHPQHFLDVAEMTMAAALGYDWFYAELPADERQSLLRAITEFGLKASFSEPEGWYITADNNWAQVVHGGLVCGAIAVWESDPELAARVVNRAVTNVKKPMEAYAPDGAYPEGCGYWDYGTTYNVVLLDVLEKIFGSDFGLSRSPGFMQTGTYITHFCTPALQWYAYSDNATNAFAQTAPYWFFNKTGDAGILFNQRRILHRKETPSLLSDRLAPCAVIWGHATPLDNFSAPDALAWHASGATPVYACRSGWDYDAAFLAMKGGSPATNHAHMDVGGFIYENDGVMWAAELGGENYNNLETNGVDLWNMKQSSSRWQVYRYGNLRHNTLTFNGQDQLVDGMVRLSETTDAFPGSAAADLTPVYAKEVKAVRRRCALLSDRSLSVEDHIETLPGRQTLMTWTLVTPATVSQKGTHALSLKSKGREMELRVEGIDKPTWEIAPATPHHEFEDPNRGFTVIHLNAQLKAASTTDLRVTIGKP